MCGPAGLDAEPDRLLWNTGGLEFEPQDQRELADAEFYGLGVLPLDIDNDRDVDLYVANDGTPNLLFENQGDGTFAERGLLYGAAYSGDGRAQAGMGIAAGDIEADGYDDLVVTNFSHDFNTIYSNTGTVPYTDATQKIGVGADSFAYLGWATHLRDFDLDGDLDLFVTNGHIYPAVDKIDVGSSYAQRNQLFVNSEGRLRQIAAGAGGPGLDLLASSRGSAVGDYDGDGDEDILVTNNDAAPTLLRNDTRAGGRSLQLRLRGESSNRDGIGARVAVKSGGQQLSRFVRTAGGYLSASDATLTFGIQAGSLVEIHVAWPSGTDDVIRDVASGQLLLIAEGRGVVAQRDLPARSPDSIGAQQD